MLYFDVFVCVFFVCFCIMFFFHRSNEAADFDKDGWHRALDVEPFRCFNGP